MQCSVVLLHCMWSLSNRREENQNAFGIFRLYKLYPYASNGSSKQSEFLNFSLQNGSRRFNQEKAKNLPTKSSNSKCQTVAFLNKQDHHSSVTGKLFSLHDMYWIYLSLSEHEYEWLWLALFIKLKKCMLNAMLKHNIFPTWTGP